MIQEFTEDFVCYLTDVEVDSHEVTLDKSTKKRLLEAIDRTTPDQEGYFDLWEDGLSDKSDDEPEIQVFGTKARGDWHPGYPTGALLRRPEPPSGTSDIELGRSDEAVRWSQRRFLPVDVECDILVQDMMKFRSDVVHMWRDYYGQAMYMSLRPGTDWTRTPECAMDCCESRRPGLALD